MTQLSLEDIQTIMPIIDAGIRAAGLRLFENGGGERLQHVLAKIQTIADEAAGSKGEGDGKTQL